jgi:hypothetical protein
MTSPTEPGIYQSKWRMSTASGNFFGYDKNETPASKKERILAEGLVVEEVCGLFLLTEILSGFCMFG